ncbi:MAG: hypothetical protein AB7F35_26780, partial [Acetobacteraceae bacterium]
MVQVKPELAILCDEAGVFRGRMRFTPKHPSRIRFARDDHVRQRGGKSPALRGGHDQAAWGGSCGISAMMGGVAISVMAS